MMKNKIVISVFMLLVFPLCIALAEDKKNVDVNQRVKQIAWKAYADATNLGILAEEGPSIKSEFILDRDVEDLGEKGVTIHEVHFVLLGGEKTRGIILVNHKTEKSLVVFPKKISAK